MNLALNYVQLAEENLNSGDVRGAIAAFDSLSHILPELTEADRESLAGSYPDLQREVQKALLTRAQTN
jgi:hypothetical protein